MYANIMRKSLVQEPREGEGGGGGGASNTRRWKGRVPLRGRRFGVVVILLLADLLAASNGKGNTKHLGRDDRLLEGERHEIGDLGLPEGDMD